MGCSIGVTASCDEDVKDVGEDELEKLVDKKGQRMIRRSPRCLWNVVADHWSNFSYTHDFRRVFQVKELLVYLWKTLISRISPILWRTLLPRLLSTPRRWLLPSSSDFERLLRYRIRQISGLSFLQSICMLVSGSPTNSFFSGFLWMRLANSTHR